MLPLRVSGDLRDVDPALLIRSLSRSRETGRLAVSEGEVTRNLFFKGGELHFATSNDPDDGLGAHLLRAGLVGFEVLAEAAAKVAPERRLGAVLIDDGRLGPEDLVEAVSAQLLEIAYAVLQMSRGRYLFDFSEVALREMIVLRRDTRAILLQGLRRVGSVSRIRRGLQQLEGRPWHPAPAETWAALDLTPSEEGVLKLLPSPWEGRPLPASGELSSFEVARSVWALSLVGLIVPLSTLKPTPAPLVGREVAPEPSARAPGAPEPEAPRPAPPAEPIDLEELESLLRSFNDKQHYLYRVLRVEIGAGADIFLRSCLKRLPPAGTALFESLGYSPAGRWDEPALAARLATLDPATAAAHLEAAIDAQVQELSRTLDEERALGIKSDLASLVRSSNERIAS